jgi:hypothetical protein
LIFTLTHQAWQKRWPSLGVSLWLNVACEFKRAGFLEGEAIETPPPIGLKPNGDLQSYRDALRPTEL